MAVPNDIGPFLLGWVASQPDLSAVVQARVYPWWRRQSDATLPAIVYQKVSDVSIGSLRGLSGLQADLYQLDCIASDRKTAHRIAGMVRGRKGDARLDRYVGSLAGVRVQACFCQDEREQPETSPIDFDVKTWAVQLDFKIWWEAVS